MPCVGSDRTTLENARLRNLYAELTALFRKGRIDDGGVIAMRPFKSGVIETAVRLFWRRRFAKIPALV